jgi:hypothetical protein
MRHLRGLPLWSINRKGIHLNEGGRFMTFVWLFPLSFYISLCVRGNWWRLFFGPAFHPKFYFGRGI